jgi:hypothetical protein
MPNHTQRTKTLIKVLEGDKIGLFNGKEVSDMNREELLEFARFATNRIVFLQTLAEEYQPDELHSKVIKSLTWAGKMLFNPVKNMPIELKCRQR